MLHHGMNKWGDGKKKGAGSHDATRIFQRKMPPGAVRTIRDLIFEVRRQDLREKRGVG